MIGQNGVAPLTILQVYSKAGIVSFIITARFEHSNNIIVSTLYYIAMTFTFNAVYIKSPDPTIIMHFV